jgi:hypothetical protein
VRVGKNCTLLQILVCGSACAICKCVQCARLPQLSRRAEAGGQKLIFSCTKFQSMNNIFNSFFQIFNPLFQCYSVFLALHTTSFSIRIVADCVALHCQVTQELKRATILEFTTVSAIIFIHCCVLVLYPPQSVRAMGQTYSLTSFDLCVGIFARLGNVYGCKGQTII